MNAGEAIVPDDSRDAIVPDDSRDAIVPDDSRDAIVPDDKDWTWVLSEVCPECGFDAAAVDTSQMGELLRSNAAVWSDLLSPVRLSRDGESVHVRPTPERWSTLEYACHVRDVFVLFDVRLEAMLVTDGARFENWDQDETARRERYGEQDPVRVREELVVAADALAARFDGVVGDQWTRTGFRSDGASFTVDSFARYLLHDPVHHLWDVGATS